MNAAGNAYVTGGTYSSDFPTTPGALQAAYGGGSDEAFVTELNGNGSALVYSTFLGGNVEDNGRGIALDAPAMHTSPAPPSRPTSRPPPVPIRPLTAVS